MINIFSMLFIFSALTSLFWGIHIIRLNPHSTINRLFFLLCLALSIWSFGFFLANLSQDLSTALLWRRFSAVGWTSIFGLTLHYLLLITNIDEKEKSNKLIFLLYIPALINMYIFALSNNMSAVQYNLKKIDYGWTNIAVNNSWDLFYYFYYLLYMLLSLIIVWHWKGKLKEKQKIFQANLIFGSIIFATVLGGIVDLVAGSFLTKPIPQMAPLFILIPVWAMFGPARRYNLVSYNEKTPEDLTISDEDRKTIFNNLSLAFYASAFLSFLSDYLPYMNMNQGNSLKLSVLKGVSLASIGLFLRRFQNIKNTRLKEDFTVIVLVFSIPLTLLQYLNYGSLTVWAFPLVIMISSVIFSKIALLFWTSVAAVFTQVLIWILRPEVTVVINKYDYILRIGMFIVAFLTGYYINKIYIAKIKENKKQVAFQTMASAISFEFVSLKQGNFDEKIDFLLEAIGEFFNVDRTYLFTIDHEKDTMTYSNEWCNTGIKEEVGTINQIPLDVFPWWIDQLQNKKIVHVKDVNFMPDEASSEQAQLLRQEVKSLISVPVIDSGKILAFIGIDSVREIKKWPQEKIDMLYVMANILHSGIVQVKADKEVEHMAYYDRLTDLPNRFLFEKLVDQALRDAKHTDKKIALLFLGLDDFKSINDTVGHRGGDILLQKVAERLHNVTRNTDILARFGGDEFMIMLDNVMDQHTIADLADEVMAIFSETFKVNGQEFAVTASTGIANYPIDGEDSDTLIKNADIAMYKAKEKGKNQYVFCSQEMKDEILQSTELSSELSHALERDELVLHYQPQINLMTNEITGVEALVRWVHPIRGMISPGIFIPLAEKTGLINSIGEWVLRTACKQNKKWQDAGFPAVVMAVNLSGVQVMDPHITNIVENIIKETQLNPKYIELEITESIAIKKTDDVVAILSQLKNTGVALAIDDFGTEYSSLSKLKLLPVNRIKIDRQFVQNIETNEKDQAIISTIINLAKSLGHSSLAEGVETVGQLDFLRHAHCGYTQGFYHYKPMPADAIEKILKDGVKIE